MAKGLTFSERRELDAEIAEKVLGYYRTGVGPDAFGEHGGCEVLVPYEAWLRGNPYALPPKGPVHVAFFVPEWSRTLDCAFELVVRMRALGFRSFSLNTCFDPELGAWCAHFVDPKRELEGLGFADEAPVAIARAALAAGKKFRAFKEVQRG